MIPFPWIVAGLAAVIGIGAAVVSKSDDGPIEQAAEEVIEAELNLPKGSVDLTPKSK
jgi:hypothetical protein